jgi:hypothetical protein
MDRFLYENRGVAEYFFDVKAHFATPLVTYLRLDSVPELRELGMVVSNDELGFFGVVPPRRDAVVIVRSPAGNSTKLIPALVMSKVESKLEMVEIRLKPNWDGKTPSKVFDEETANSELTRKIT